MSTVNKVCYIWNKYQLPGNLVKHQYFYTRNFVSLLHFKKNWRSPSQTFLQHLLFTTFSLILTVSEVFNISNKYWLPNKSSNKLFLHKKPNTSLHTIKYFALSIPNAFRNIHLLTDFYCFSKWPRCAIFQINANLPVIYQKINIFTQESLYPSII